MRHRKRQKAMQISLIFEMGPEAQMNSSQTEDVIQSWESRNLFNNLL